MNKFLLFLAASAISIPAFAADGSVIVDEETSYIYRVISENDATVSSAGVQTTLNPTDVVIPSTITYEGKTYTVVAVGDKSFDEVESIINVTLPETIKSIGVQAFYNCPSLAKININEGVTSIGDEAFALCPMLGNVTLPATLNTIGSSVFRGTSSMTAIRVADGNTSFISDQGALYDFEGDRLIACPGGKKNNFAIRDYCTTIDPYAFAGTYISGVNLSGSIETIGDHAFDASHIETITIPGTVTNMGKAVFANCTDLTEVTYFQGNKKVSDGSFMGCTSLTKVNLPTGITSIGMDAFKGCSALKEITFPNTLSDIGTSTNPFNGCSSLEAINVAEGNPDYSSVDGVLYDADGTLLILCPGGKSGSYTIPAGTKTIYKYSFSGCKNITEIILGPDVTHIGMHAFEECTGLTSVIFNNKLTAIDGYAFIGCPIKELNLPVGITEISFGAFCSNTALEKLILPYTVSNIYSDAFSYCFSLKEIYCLAPDVPVIDSATAFTYVPSTTMLYVPAGCKQYYESNAMWSSFFPVATELPALSVTIDSESVEIENIGETVQLSIDIKEEFPIKALDTTWHSNNSSVAKVNEDGLVTAIGPGTATISARVTDNTDTSHTVKCTVTVIDAGVDTILLDDDNLEIYTISGVYAGNRIDGLKSGIYVVKQGTKTIKHVVK